ncbi:MAG: ATP synthase F0 subunit C [Thermodesulfobacteriota bacterium]|nr:ATP synthase F0 subunit C [Thermodesulfobacteriota bacterium]
MMDSITYISASSFIGAAMAMGLGAIGAALGLGYAAGRADESMSYRPEMSGQLLKNMLIGQAITETAAIFALVIAIILLFAEPASTSVLASWSAIGAGLSIGLSAIGSGVGAGLPAGAACVGMARQPDNKGKIFTTMLIGSAICQTPVIFGMVISFLLLFMDLSDIPLYPGWAAILGAGLATGLATIGSGIGNGLTSMEAVRGIARNPDTSSDTSRVMLIGMSVGQSTAIYGFLVSLLLVFTGLEPSTTLASSLKLIGAGLSSGFGGIGPGIGLGIVSAYAVKWVARRPEATGTLTRTMLVGMAVTESTAIYGLIVALLLVVVF